MAFVELVIEIDDNCPNGVLINRTNLKPPYRNAMEEHVMTDFVARLALTMANENNAKVQHFTVVQESGILKRAQGGI